MKGSVTLLALFLALSWQPTSGCSPQENPQKRVNAQDSAAERLEQLLARPPCLETFVDSVKSYTVEEVSIPSGAIRLSGKLYLPLGAGRCPAVVFMHGGGNDRRLLMSAPRFYAPRFAHCGLAALIYDKRGTGESGGVFHESDYDDFIADAGNAAVFLAKDKRVDPKRIAIHGGSEGGRLAPVAAVRFPIFSYVISVSGPIGSVADQATFNMRYALRVRGNPDSTIERVMPLWKRHHDAWAAMDTVEMNIMAGEIIRLRESLNPFVIPSTRQEILTDSGLFFLRPQFSSMRKDYTQELKMLRVPWLAVFGEIDSIINVQESVQNISPLMQAAGNRDYEVFVIKDVDHSFYNPRTRRWMRTLGIYINWLKEKMGEE